MQTHRIPASARGQGRKGISTSHLFTYMLSRVLKCLAVTYTVGHGAPFIAGRDLRMRVVMPAGELANASAAGYRCEGILIDRTSADP